MAEHAASGTDEEWFRETGHCGMCGETPGQLGRCSCRGACGCAWLHIVPGLAHVYEWGEGC